MKTLTKVKIDKKLLIDVFAASIIVQQAPKLLNKYFFKSKPLVGDTLELAGAASAYLLGMVLKRGDIANAGIALAAADLANEKIGTSLLGTPATTTPPTTGGMGDFSNDPLLRDYTNNLIPLKAAQYMNAYN